MPKPDREIRTINYGRGLAALLVVLFHNEPLVQKYFGQLGAEGWFFAGQSGVEYFFVLSGLIIFGVHYRDIGQPGEIRPYVVKRLIRIFPMFWLVVVPLGFAFLADRNLGADRSLTGTEFLCDVFLVPREGKLTLPPAWTLQHELVFYAVFAMLILSRWLGIVLFALWQFACLITIALDLIPVGYQNVEPAARLIGHQNFGFLIGLGIVALDRKIGLSGRRSAQIVGVLGGILLAGVFVAEGARGSVLVPNAAAEAAIYFVSYACIVIGLLAMPNMPRPWLDGTLGRLGQASYVLYLIHEPVGSATIVLLNQPAIRPIMSAHVAYWCCVSIAVAASFIIHFWLEKPMLAFLRKVLVPSPAKAALPQSRGAS